MGTEQRYDIYDLFLTFPEPLVPRHRRLEVAERLDRKAPSSRRSMKTRCATRSTASFLQASKRWRSASCIPTPMTRTNSRVAAIARERHPQLALSVSCDVVPELGEYQRCVTTCANAYVQPLMARYVARLAGTCASAALAARCV